MKSFVILGLLALTTQSVSAQVKIGGTGGPVSSAVLELSSTNRGLIIPRVSLQGIGDVNTIPFATTSTLVYNTNTVQGSLGVEPGFYYWENVRWVRIGDDGWSTSGNYIGTSSRFLGTLDNYPLSFRVNNAPAGKIDHLFFNTYLGYQAALNSAGIQGNVGIGHWALRENQSGNTTAAGAFALSANTTGAKNSAFGYSSLRSNSTGNENTAVGHAALQNGSGNYNTAIGSNALSANAGGNDNTAVGTDALRYGGAGMNNTAVGSQANRNNDGGNNNTSVGYSALFTNISGHNNTSVGSNSLFANNSGFYNTAVGTNTLKNNFNGYYNTALGSEALYSNTGGINNLAVGMNVLHENTTGTLNTASGNNSMFYNQSGSYNTATGVESLYLNTLGSDNTSMGYQSLQKNDAGTKNVAVGVRALFSETGGSNNTAVGYQSLNTITSGIQNVAVGSTTLNSLISGSGNSALGYGADVINNASNSTAIGYNAYSNASNKIRIGNTSVSVIEGQVPFSSPSDARFKTQVKHDVPGLAFITQLKPVTYVFDDEMLDHFARTGEIKPTLGHHAGFSNTQSRKTGFLAQDVEELSKAIGYEFDGLHKPENERDHFSLSYSQFVVPLVKAVQEQQEIIKTQQNDIAELKATVLLMQQQLQKPKRRKHN